MLFLNYTTNLRFKRH